MPKRKERRKFEARFTTRLTKWLKYNINRLPIENKNVGPIEAKVCYDERFNIKNSIKEHQLKNLIAIREGKPVFYKISDFDRTTRKPWDLDCYNKSRPFFAIMWYGPTNRLFYLVDPLVFYFAIKAGKASFIESEIEKEAFCIGYSMD